jgi:Zn-dependent M28 family amino/carboxypeptidase
LIPDFKSQNLGCRIKGSSGSDSVIVFSAHYDHLGGIGKDCYFPGANDNASGVSMVLNLLHYYTNHPPKYTTVFLFFAGEEAGLLGSAYFTESGQMDLQKIKFLINLDLLGTGDDGIMVVNGAIHQKEFERLNELNAKSNLLPQIRKRGKAANSDHYWFTEKGVPAFFVYTMGGISAYHDVYDRPETLPLTRYQSVFKLLTEFVSTF